MQFSKNKIFSYSIIAVLSLLLIANSSLTGEDFRFLETSYLSILQKIAAENKLQQPDLSIENVTLRKIADPKETFPYYKYDANIVLKNYGGDLKNAKVVINGGDDQKYEFIKNSLEGFSLLAGKSYILDRYDVIFDGNYNGGEITLGIDIKDHEESDKSNNSFTIDVFELPAKLENIALTEGEQGSFEIEFTPVKAALNTDQFEIISSDFASFEDEEEKYAELFYEESIYGYHRIKNSSDVVNDSKWQKEWRSKDNLTADKTSRYFYVKATNAGNGYFAVSNIIKLSPQKELDRAEFAKLFLDYADIKPITEGEILYKDISDTAWYNPYVKTLYNLGLIGTSDYNYHPDKAMTRGEVLRVVLDYFDVDLAVSGEGAAFEDLDEQDYLTPYVKALYASGKGSIFGNSIHKDLPATKDFLRYLIYEYN